ncbi:transglycosylase SLT domain-containing protein [Microvirga mediterraneensis]|uniref:Transglycosylase SLT domain-containing protein n=1 Tax=Microvirga mediterraneensis TaxID=2754695 RepID=A0A838BVG1_9HYPH|nr:transglycosylase SLT domain-containing protein [Microvirga mediterraneensis]MBA1159338.1 transglycosylase SLT domain-containing protein [Microvirga mediterraneensis]
MPTVPTYDQRQVRDAPAPNQYQHPSASPDDSGAATGRALQGLGGEIARAGVAFSNEAERQQEKDQAAQLLQAQADYSSRLNRALYTDETLPDGTVRKGLFTTQGSEAMGAAGRFATIEEDVYRAVTGTLKDPAQAERFNQIRTRSRMSYETAAVKHEADNRVKFQAEAQDAAVKTATLNAVNGYDKPEILQEEMGNIRRAVAAANAGSAQDVIDYKSRVAISGVHKAIFGRMLRDDDAKAALNYYETNKGEIEGADHIEIQRALEVPLRRQQAQDYLSGVTVAGSPGTKLVRAVVGSESSGNPGAVSPKGAAGLMQVMPGTAKEIDDALGGIYGLSKMSDAQVQEFYKQNPAVNLEHGAFYLQQQLTKYSGDIEAALIAYNAGPANADKWLNAGRDYAVLPRREETEPYVRKTLTRYAEEMGGPVETKPTLRDMPDLPPVGRRVTQAEFPADSYYKPDQVFRGRPGAFVDQRALVMANELGRRFEELTGRRVEMNSGFRDPGTNASVGGAKSSRHMHGDAFDFNIKDLPDEEKTAFLQLARQVGFTGVGFYEDGPGHLHLDIGRARSWGGLPQWARGATQETQTTGYLGQPTMAAGYGNLPMPANMARMASGVTSPYAAIAAQGAFPVTAPVAGAPVLDTTTPSPVTMTPLVNAPVDVPPAVSTRVRPDDFDPDAMRAYAQAAPENIRDTVVRQTEARIAQMERQRKSVLKDTGNQAWAHVLQGGSVDDLPPEIYSALIEQSPETVKRMQDYEDRRETKRDKTDEGTYYRLSQMTPEQLAADDFNLMDYADRLSGEHLRHFAQKQADAKKGVRDASQGAGILTVKELGTMALGKMGIATTGKEATAESEARAGLFFMRLEQEVSAVQVAQKRKATNEEIQKIVDALSTPVTQGGFFSGKAKYRFEMGRPEENESRIRNNLPPIGETTGVFDVASKLEDVPDEARTMIIETHRRLTGEAPTSKKTASIYNEILTAHTGRPVPVPSDKINRFKTQAAAALGRVPTDLDLSMLYSQWLRREYPLRIGE